MLRTPLYETHKRLGARLVEFGGWEMPVMYRGINEEHVYTRTASTIFDVSHMGRLKFIGEDAEKLLERVCTRNIAKLAVGKSAYSHICNEQGGILDDVIVSRFKDHLYMVCNAGNREKNVAHLKTQSEGLKVKIDDTTTATVMLAIQGPQTIPMFKANAEKLPIKIAEMPRYGFISGGYMGMNYTVFRSGYTGEDGLEIVLPAAAGVLVWDFLTKEGDADRVTIRPAGLGARDTLRLEAAMPLYGHELNESIDPISAGCKWCVDLTKDFIGAAALRQIDAEGPARKITGLVLEGKRIARQGAKILANDAVVGEVTSGTLSPTLGKSIAMGYVESTWAKPDAPLKVEVSGTAIAATVVPLPFYKRS